MPPFHFIYVDIEGSEIQTDSAVIPRVWQMTHFFLSNFSCNFSLSSSCCGSIGVRSFILLFEPLQLSDVVPETLTLDRGCSDSMFKGLKARAEAWLKERWDEAFGRRFDKIGRILSVALINLRLTTIVLVLTIIMMAAQIILLLLR
jgi:hypothetical protein